MSISLRRTRSTYRVVCLLLAKHEIELGGLMIRIGLGPENDHYAVLQEVIELYGIRVKPLDLEIVNPGRY